MRALFWRFRAIWHFRAVLARNPRAVLAHTCARYWLLCAICYPSRHKPSSTMSGPRRGPLPLPTREDMMMRTEQARPVRLEDYRPPDWLVDTVELDVSLHPTEARVRATLKLRPNPAA